MDEAGTSKELAAARRCVTFGIGSSLNGFCRVIFRQFVIRDTYTHIQAYNTDGNVRT